MKEYLSKMWWGLILVVLFFMISLSASAAEVNGICTNEWTREWTNKKGKKVVATWVATDELHDAIYLIDESGREFWMGRDGLCKDDRLFVQKTISNMYLNGYAIRNRRFVPIKLWAQDEISRRIVDIEVKLERVLSLLGDVKYDVNSARRAAESADRSSRRSEDSAENVRRELKLRDFD